jgi:hypothetical protein
MSNVSMGEWSAPAMQATSLLAHAAAYSAGLYNKDNNHVFMALLSRKTYYTGTADAFP